MLCRIVVSLKCAHFKHIIFILEIFKQLKFVVATHEAITIQLYDIYEHFSTLNIWCWHAEPCSISNLHAIYDVYIINIVAKIDDSMMLPKMEYIFVSNVVEIDLVPSHACEPDVSGKCQCDIRCIWNSKMRYICIAKKKRSIGTFLKSPE